MFGGLVICFVISYIVHLVHVSLDLGKMIVFNLIAVCLLVAKDNFCQVMKFDEFKEHGSEAGVKAAGGYRQQGDYIRIN